MKQEHELVAQVYAARSDTLAADQLVRQYLPFIKSETAKFIHRFPEEGHDDELSIAMFAFHEAVMSYQKTRGAFLKYAAVSIKNRLIDYARRESRHAGTVSLDHSESDEVFSSRSRRKSPNFLPSWRDTAFPSQRLQRTARGKSAHWRPATGHWPMHGKIRNCCKNWFRAKSCRFLSWPPVQVPK